MSTFLLVPGSWLGAWAWRRVAPMLRDAGHDVHPVTLTGLGDRAHLGCPETDLSTHIRDVVALLDAEELDDVVLVGHSYAGVVAEGAAAHAPGRVARLVFLAATVAREGRSLFDAAPPEFRAAIEASAAVGGDGWRIPMLSDDELAAYYPGHGLSDEDLAWVRRHATDHPIATYGEPTQPANGVPRTYVRCTGDVGKPPVAPATPGWDHEQLDSGHWPMITRPGELAELLAWIAAV